MNQHKDIQQLIPDSYRELVEVAPRGFLQSTAIGALLLGAFGGAWLASVVSHWWVGIVVGILMIIQRLHAWRSDKLYDQRMKELRSHNLDWKPEDHEE